MQNFSIKLLAISIFILLARLSIVKIDVKIIIFVSIMFLIFTNNSNMEHLTPTTLTSNESLQNLSAVYNSGTANLTNLNITGTLTVGNTVIDQNNLINKGTLTVGNTVIDQNNLTNKGNITTNQLNLPYGENVLNYGADVNAWHIYADGSNHVIHQGGINSARPNYYFGTDGILRSPKISTGTINASGNIKTTARVMIGGNNSDYTLSGHPDGFKLSAGSNEGNVDPGRFWWNRDMCKNKGYNFC